MAHDAQTWIVRREKVAVPPNFSIYNATRKSLPAEAECPDVGTEVSSIAGFTSKYAGHFVIASGQSVGGDKVDAWFHFCTTPGNHVEYESMGYVFPPIYPPDKDLAFTNFPGGAPARSRVVYAEVTHEYNHGGPLAAWLTDPVVATNATSGPFQPKSVLLQSAAEPYQDLEGTWKTIGTWLQGQFLAQDTLNDGIAISLNKYPESLSYNIDPSIPSATTYDGWVTSKTKFIADRVIRKWRGGFYVRVTRKVVAQ